MDFVCVLTHEKLVSEKDASKLLQIYQGKRLRRLGKGGVEFLLKEPLKKDDPRLLSNLKIDVNFVPRVGREKSLLVADMDKTIISVECIDELAQLAGRGKQVAKITSQAMSGKLDFQVALNARVKLLEGQPKSILEECINKNVFYNPGARTLLGTMLSRGAHAALVSGGFTYFSKRVARALGMFSHTANVLDINKGMLTGKVISPIFGGKEKVDMLKKLRSALNLSDSDIISVGDGANDIGIINQAGLGVAYHAKTVVNASTPYKIRFSDLRALLYLQGITADEFVTV